VKGRLAKVDAYRTNLHVSDPPQTSVPKIVLRWRVIKRRTISLTEYSREHNFWPVPANAAKPRTKPFCVS